MIRSQITQNFIWGEEVGTINVLTDILGRYQHLIHNLDDSIIGSQITIDDLGVANKDLAPTLLLISLLLGLDPLSHMADFTKISLLDKSGLEDLTVVKLLTPELDGQHMVEEDLFGDLYGGVLEGGIGWSKEGGDLETVEIGDQLGALQISEKQTEACVAGKHIDQGLGRFSKGRCVREEKEEGE